MASVNKVIIVGNCGRDPELRYLPSGMAVAGVSIATTSRRKDKQSGEVIEETQWHRVQFFDRLAEIVGEYVKKGSAIYVEGRLRYGKYTDKDGIEKPTCDIIASEMQLLGGREGGAGQDEHGERTQQQRRPQGRDQEPARRQPPRQPPRTQQQRGGGSGFDDMDDDIPF